MKHSILATFLSILSIASAEAAFSIANKAGTLRGNNTAIDLLPLGLAEVKMFTFDKRQSCPAGTGSCPGSSRCYDLNANIGCCGSAAIYKTSSCCRGQYYCDAGEDCCLGTSGQQGCMPEGSVCCANGGHCDPGEECCAGTQGQLRCIPAGSVCCADGGYCDPGEICVRYENESTIRCRSVGGGGGGGTGTTTTRSRTTGSTPATTSFVANTPEYYTITFTIYWTIYTYTSISANFASTTYYYSDVIGDYTSTRTALSTSATNSAAARDVLSSEADDITSSLSSAAATSSSSMSSVASRQRASLSSSLSRAGTSSFPSATSNTNGGGGGSGGASSASTLQAHGKLVLAVSAIVTFLVGGLMIGL